MKRTLTLVPAALVGLLLLAGLVYGVLMVANVAEPAATTVQGMTSDRLWATSVAGLALLGVVIGGLALVRANRRIGNGGRNGAIVALVVGTVAAVNGGLLLALADGGPGTGNGVVGAAGALVLGVVAVGLGGVVLVQARG